jgi:hypothetical protein
MQSGTRHSAAGALWWAHVGCDAPPPCRQQPFGAHRPNGCWFHKVRQRGATGARVLLARRSARWRHSWATVTNALALREGLERLFHGHQRCCLDRGESAACRDRQHDAGQRDIVRRLVDRVAVVFAKAIPETVEGPPYLFELASSRRTWWCCYGSRVGHVRSSRVSRTVIRPDASTK